jgi:hypothetical protein
MGSFLRLAISTALTALAVPFYLRWSSQQVNYQFDKMQKAAHFTPGAEPPLPPVGIGIGHFVVGRLLRLGWLEAAANLLLGLLLGVTVFIYRSEDEEV